MKTEAFITKGSRVRVERFVVAPLGSYALAGAQMKVAAEREAFSGTVEKVWGNHPTAPTVVTFGVRKDDGAFVEVDRAHVVGVE